MKKNQDKRRAAEKAVASYPDETGVRKPEPAGRKTNLSELTLVPFNLRSKF
jgi:hypothetical protein